MQVNNAIIFHFYHHHLTSMTFEGSKAANSCAIMTLGHKMAIFIKRFFSLSPAPHSWWRCKLPSCVPWLTILSNLGVLMRVINNTVTRKLLWWVLRCTWYFFYFFLVNLKTTKIYFKGQFWANFRKPVSSDSNTILREVAILFQYLTISSWFLGK